MRALLRLSKDKSALSNIVAYVLLIAITVALSTIVYSWLRFYVTTEEVEACSEDVNIIIRNYQCFDNSRLQITLKNKGLFTVDGYIVRVHNRTDAEFGIYLFNDTGTEIEPGDEITDIYYFDNESFQDLNNDAAALATVTLLEVQPFMMDKGEIACKAYSSQEIECSP